MTFTGQFGQNDSGFGNIQLGIVSGDPVPGGAGGDLSVIHNPPPQHGQTPLTAKPQHWMPGINWTNPLARGLVAYLPLNGNLTDVASGKTAAAGNSGVSFTLTDAGWATYHDLDIGVDNSIHLQGDYSSIVANNAYSVSMWVYLDEGSGANGTGWLWSKRWSSASIGQLYVKRYGGTGSYDPSNLAIFFQPKSAWDMQTEQVGAGWHHVVATYDGHHYEGEWSRMQLYLDGGRGQQAGTQGDPISVDTSEGDMTVGGQSGGLCFNGWIANAMIWDRALSAGEINALYANPHQLIEPPYRVARAQPGATFTGSADITCTATVQANASATYPAAAAITATASVQAIVELGQTASASLTATATVTAQALRTKYASVVPLTATATLESQAEVNRPGSANLTATATVQAKNPLKTKYASAAIAASAAVSNSGTYHARTSAAISTISSLLASAAANKVGGASASATASLGANAQRRRFASAAISASGSVAASALRTSYVQATINCSAITQAQANLAAVNSANLQASATVTARGSASRPATASISGSTSLTAAARSRKRPRVAATATATVSGSYAYHAAAQATATFSTSVSADSLRVRPASASISTQTTMTASAGRIQRAAASLSGSCSLAVTARRRRFSSAAASASATVAASGKRTRISLAAMVASGTAQAQAILAADAAASMAASASVTCSATADYLASSAAVATATVKARNFVHITEAVRNYLLAQPGVSDLVDDRIYPMWLPQRATLPAIVFTPISNVHGLLINSPSDGRAVCRLQHDIYGNTPEETLQVADALRKALQGFAGEMAGVKVLRVSLDNQLDMDEPEETPRQVMDWLVTYEVSRPIFRSEVLDVERLEEGIVTLLDEVAPTYRGYVPQWHNYASGPAITYSRRSAGEHLLLSEVSGVKTPSFDLTLYAARYSDLVHIANAVRERWLGLSFVLDTERIVGLSLVNESGAYSRTVEGSDSSLYYATQEWKLGAS